VTDPDVARPALSSAWLTVAVLGAAVNLRAAVTSVGALLPEAQAALQMSALRVGLLTSLPVVSFGVVALLSNRIARRLGLTRALTVATAAVAVGLLLRVAVVDSTWLLATSLIVLSGIAVGNVLLPVAIRAWFPDRVGPMTGWYAIALSLGTGLPAALTVPFAAALGGWRPGLAIWALPAFLAVLPWVLALRAGPASTSVHRRDPAATLPLGSSSSSDPASKVAPDAPPGLSGVPADSGRQPAPPVHRRLQSWALAVFFGIQSLEAYVVMGWLPSILRDAGLSAERAGAMLGVAMIVGGPVALLLPRVAGRTNDQRPFVVGLVLLSAGGYTGLLLLGLRAATATGTAALSSFRASASRSRAPRPAQAVSSWPVGSSWSLRSTADAVTWVSTVLIEMCSRPDLAVGVAPGDVAQDLLLAGGELVELRVLAVHPRGQFPGEGVEDEPGQPRAEHRIALMDPHDRPHEVLGGDRLGDVAAGAGPDHRITSSAASETDRARKRTSGWVSRIASRTARPPPPGMWTSRSTTSGLVARIPWIAPSTSPASPTMVTCVAELGDHPGSEQPVVVDEEDRMARLTGGDLLGCESVR
jgi:MFS transporter, CP family, cyanate transporter